MLKIKDSSGATIGVLEDDKSAPAMVKKIKPTDKVLSEEKDEKESEESEGENE